MTINNQIRDEKLRYNINIEAAKILALSSGKIHKYEYLTGEDILPSNQQQIIEQTEFTYSPLGKAFEKLSFKTLLSGTFRVRMRRICFQFRVHISQKLSPENSYHQKKRVKM